MKMRAISFFTKNETRNFWTINHDKIQPIFKRTSWNQTFVPPEFRKTCPPDFSQDCGETRNLLTNLVKTAHTHTRPHTQHAFYKSRLSRVTRDVSESCFESFDSFKPSYNQEECHPSFHIFSARNANSKQYNLCFPMFVSISILRCRTNKQRYILNQCTAYTKNSWSVRNQVVHV